MFTKCTIVFFEGLKSRKGNAHGFPGLSDYIIFRVVEILLDKEFLPNKHTKETLRFESSSDELWIGQGVAIEVGANTQYPDVVIGIGNQLFAAVQVKLYWTGGQGEIAKEIQKLDQLKTSHAPLRAMLVVFGGVPVRSRLRDRLNEARAGRDWFDFVVLQDNDELISFKLENSLGLKGIKAQIT